MAAVSDPEEGVLAQTHDPGEQEMAVGGEGGLGEGGREGIDAGPQRRYHGPHGRSSWLLASVTFNGGASPSVSTARSGTFCRATACRILRTFRYIQAAYIQA